MTPAELRARTRAFAVSVVEFTRTLPKTMEALEMAGQLRRAATSMSGNYRAAGRARSRREFIARLGVVLEEADESEHWLELLGECRIASGEQFDRLKDEASQLRAIFYQSAATARRNQGRRIKPGADH
jgi:four helix bundle protein